MTLSLIHIWAMRDKAERLALHRARRKIDSRYLRDDLAPLFHIHMVAQPDIEQRDPVSYTHLLVDRVPDGSVSIYQKIKRARIIRFAAHHFAAVLDDLQIIGLRQRIFGQNVQYTVFGGRSLERLITCLLYTSSGAFSAPCCASK